MSPQPLAVLSAAALVLAMLSSCGGGGGAGGSTPAAAPELPAREALIARALALEINTPYVPPPGDVLEHHTSGYAKVMCSAVFITGLDPADAAETIGYFVAPYAQRQRVGTPVVDRVKREVRISILGGQTLVARHRAHRAA